MFGNYNYFNNLRTRLSSTVRKPAPNDIVGWLIAVTGRSIIVCNDCRPKLNPFNVEQEPIIRQQTLQEQTCHGCKRRLVDV